MTDATIRAGGASVTGCLKELLAGRPMAGPVRGDRQTVRVTIIVQGERAAEQVAALQAAAGLEPLPMNSRAALIIAVGLIDAEVRRLDVDALAAQHGCEDAEMNARRHDELAQALALIKEMLIDDAI